MEGLVLALEDDLLLLGAGLGHEPLPVLLGVLDRAVGNEGARDEADGHPDDDGNRRHDHDDEFRHLSSHPLEPVWALWRPRAGASVRIDVTVDVRPGCRV